MRDTAESFAWVKIDALLKDSGRTSPMARVARVYQLFESSPATIGIFHLVPLTADY